MIGQQYSSREFPGGLVVRIPGFHCCGLGSIPGWGTEILQAMWGGQKTKQNKTKQTNKQKIDIVL